MTPPERLQDVTLAERLLGEIRGAVARGWCSPENQHKEMDVTLALAIADEVARLWQVEAAAALSVRGEPVAFSTVGPDGENSQYDHWHSMKHFDAFNKFAVLREGHHYVFAYQPTIGQQAVDALRIAEAALADIGDADREPGDDVAWCERRAAQALPTVRAALAAHGKPNG